MTTARLFLPPPDAELGGGGAAAGADEVTVTTAQSSSSKTSVPAQRGRAANTGVFQSKLVRPVGQHLCYLRFSPLGGATVELETHRFTRAQRPTWLAASLSQGTSTFMLMIRLTLKPLLFFLCSMTLTLLGMSISKHTIQVAILSILS